MDQAGPSSGGRDATIVVINLRSKRPNRVEGYGEDCEAGGGMNVEIYDEREQFAVAHDMVVAWDLGPDQWAALARTQGCAIRAHKGLLTRESTYFRSLFSVFRESQSDAVDVVWDVATFITFLQFLYCGKLEVSPANVVTLLEGATYFGIDKVLGQVDSWAAKSMLSTEKPIDENVLRITPLLWSSAKDVAASTLLDICVESFSIHFVAGMCLEGFENLPSAFLNACLEHPQLTVHSERQLCEALIRWCTGQSGCEDWFNSRTPGAQGHQFECLKKIRVFLLPLDYLYGSIIGKFPVNLFYLGANKDPENWGTASDALHGSMEPVLRSGGNNTHCTLRLTQYLETLDLSGCQQVISPILIESATCAPATSERAVTCAPNNFGNDVHPSGSLQVNILSSTSEMAVKDGRARLPSLKRLCRVCLSSCWRLKETDLASWLGEACPALRELIVADCPQLRVSLLSMLARPCPFIRVADFSLDISHFDRQTVHVEEQSAHSANFTPHPFPWWCPCLLEHLSDLSLQGRKDVYDSDLANIAGSCPSLLEVNLSGCTALSDSGISQFLRGYTRLLGLKGECTKFGALSTSSLIGTFEHGTTLDLGSCHELQENHFEKLLKTAASLKTLALSNTKLSNTALYMFVGEGLELLDVSETSVSGPALAYVIAKNPGLKSLNTKGCKRVRNVEENLTSDVNAITPTSFHGALQYGSMRLLELKAGWGFSDYVFSLKMPALAHIRSLDIGLGASSTVKLLPNLSGLQQLSLSFQTVSDASMSKLFGHATNLQVLELRNCMGSLSSACIASLASKDSWNLTSLKLERVAPSLTDDDLLVLGTSCKGLRYLALTGCKALTARGLEIIGDKWPGLLNLKLEECGGTTSDGACHVLRSCRALRELHLRHNGRGLPTGFVIDAVTHLPLLYFLALDQCDAPRGGFEVPTWGFFGQRAFTFHLSKCKPIVNPFQIQGHNLAVPLCHRKTEIHEWHWRYRLSSAVVERL